MSHTCELKQQPVRPTAHVRVRTPADKLPQVFGQAYGQVAQFLGQHGETPAGAPYAAYHNMDMSNLDVEIGFPVARAVAGEGDILAGAIPAGRMATCLYVGPYDGMAAAYDALAAWMAQKGLTPTGISYEFYLDDPMTTPAERLRTEIMFPVA